MLTMWLAMYIIYTHLYTADYDGTDIRRPYIVDNSTGTPVYKYLDGEDHPPSSHTKRGATAHRHHLWPQGVVTCSISDHFTSKHYLHNWICMIKFIR